MASDKQVPGGAEPVSDGRGRTDPVLRNEQRVGRDAGLAAPAGAHARGGAYLTPVGVEHEAALSEGIMLTKLDAVVAWGRKNSLWPIPFGTACCGIEFMGVVSSVFDLSRFGAELVRFSPRQADLMIIAGTITYKMGPVIRRIYDQMSEPKYVIAMGVCASSGGFYDNYCTMQGVDKILPVDYYVAGCPPRPESVLQAVIELQGRLTRTKQV